jgi:protoporphyrinogen oxidase
VLLEIMDPPIEKTTMMATKQLKYRSFLTVCLIINNPKSFPDNWIYIHEPSVKVARIQNFKNWSPALVADPSKTALGMEFFCWQNDEFWKMKDEDLIKLAANELEIIGLGKSSEVVDGMVIRAADAYPIYMLGYEENLEIVLNYLKNFKNLFSIGRAGMYRWNNMDHSILTGLYTARNIAGASYNVEAINAEAEYHEMDYNKLDKV